MGYYSKYTDRMDIHIEENRGTILIRQKWKYSWLNAMDTSIWTYSEKQDFHEKVDNLIFHHWGEHYFVKTKGISEFSKRNIRKIWNINFDIQWVLNSEHWKVNVTKYPKNHIGVIGSAVRWNSKEIILDTKDTSWRKIPRGKKNYFQYPVVHEFGHAVGNSIFACTGMHGDEYKSSSDYYEDKSSLMNIGNKIRDRHLDYLLTQLNTMIPNTEFTIY